MKKIGWISIGGLLLVVGSVAGYYGKGILEDGGKVAVLPQSTEQVSSKNKYEEGQKELERSNEESRASSTNELTECMNEAWIQAQIDEYQRELGWMLILSDEQSFATDYHVVRGENILSGEKVKQLFTMEYLVGHKSNDYTFMIQGEQGLEMTDDPTQEFIAAYLDYGTFNDQYRYFFNKDFDINAGMHMEGEEEQIARDYVYYDNRRPGSNGVQVEEITVGEYTYDEGAQLYTVALTISYSERAQEMLGRRTDEVSLSYKVKDEHMVLCGLKCNG